jgi:hypothetical protein
MVDKIWWKWQRGCVEFESKYSGSLNTVLPPFNTTVQQIMSTTGTLGSKYCYQYSQTLGDLPLQLKCPGKTVTTTGASARPTKVPEVMDEFWLEKMIQNLVFMDRFQIRFLKNQTRLLKRNEYGNGTTCTTVEKVKSTTVQSTIMGSITSTSTHSSTATAVPTPPIVYEFNSNYTIHAPPETDRQDRFHLRHPSSLPKSFIKHMKLNEYKVRRVEAYIKSIVDDYNNKKEYVSPAALENYHRNNRLGLWKPKKKLE